MMKDLSIEEKEQRFSEIINFANKINNLALKNACLNILNNYKEKIFARGAGNDGVENIKNVGSHQCFDGGLLVHTLNVTRNAYNIGTTYQGYVDMDLIIFGAILHDIGKTKIFDEYKKDSEVKSNLNYKYLLVDHVYIGEKIVEEYLDKENIEEKLKYQALHIIATHMDTLDKHMAEAYIVSYADSIDADVENIISYPRNAVNPLTNSYMYESENK